MSSIELILAAIALAAVSGFPSLALAKRPRMGQVLAAVLLAASSALGLSGAVQAFGPSPAPGLEIAWSSPWGVIGVGLDALSGIFLIPIFIVPTLGAVYGLGYRDPATRPAEEARLGVFYGLLAAGMALVVVARDAVLFLFAWEAMALASWFAATTEWDKPEVRRAGWIYLVATHVGTLALYAMFSIWKGATGSFALARAAAVPPEVGGAIFVLALLGFGLKAGLVPLHVWLPGAHANAPSHVSAVMSGVMIKLGIYGILRMTGLLPAPPEWWGWTLLGIGGISALAGIAWATAQADLKRVLAYSSVENIGIVTMGAGLSLVGRAIGRPSLILLGMGAALFHVWNHSMFKSLLFLGAGRVLHATGTRRLEHLGGLISKMPLTAALFAVGAVAIAALPPFNGFMSEWLLYLGFFRGVVGGPGPSIPAVAAAAAVLATVGALAMAAFVRLFGVVFLGSARSASTREAHHEGGAGHWFMAVPMVALALGCLVAGLAPGLLLPTLGRAAGEWGNLRDGAQGLAALANFSWTLPLGAAIGIGAALAAFVFALAARTSGVSRRLTWDCGYAAPSSRMQYGASSFAEFLDRNLAFVLARRRKVKPPQGAFPTASSFSSRTPDPVLDLVVRPFAAAGRRAAPKMRVLHQGQTQLYLVYILVVTVILLVAGASLP